MSKTILITGASSGFGEACARRFAEQGHKLILIARRQERLAAIKAAFSMQQIHNIAVDMRDHKNLKLALDTLPKEFLEIDVCINNAGLALGKEPAFKADLSDWEAMIDTNIKGVIYCTHLVLPNMVRRNKGHIVNISSIAGDVPYPGANVYGASKAFVDQFSKNLKADLLGTNVRVSNIRPGLAETEFSSVRFHGDKSKAKAVYKGTQPILAEDIAATIDWIINTPSHININSIEIMPTCQAWNDTAVHRETSKSVF